MAGYQPLPASPSPSAIESTPIQVQFETLGEVQGTLNSRAIAIADQLSALARQLDPLEETWTGATATYFEGLKQEWNTSAAGLFAPDGVLGDIAKAMGLVFDNCSQAEWDNMRTWQPG
jgi:WXG100 family type VII secretion target